MVEPIDTGTMVRRHAASRHARRDAGRSRRSTVPLEDHAWVPDQSERKDPVAVLTAQDESRLPELVPIRHGRMMATPFTFYRGAAAMMAADLSMSPTTDLEVQLCGDAHLSNFGLFNGPDRRVLFDVNDFDETLPGPFEWDVKRLAASVIVAGRNNHLSSGKIEAAAADSVRGYREMIATAAEQAPLALHYFRLEIDQLVRQMKPKQRSAAAEASKKAGKKNSMRALRKLTDIVDGRRVIVPDPPLITPIEVFQQAEHMAEIEAFFGSYLATLPRDRRLLLERYSPVDIARKVVGVGSVGTRCVILLLESGNGEPLFLQFKEAGASVLEPYLGASDFGQAGERVVEGQRLMQAASDIFLGWAQFAPQDARPIDFYFRQLWDGKASADVDSMRGGRLARYGAACGGALALGHARSGDAPMISGYLGDDDTFDQALVEFGEKYADLNENDHAAHLAATKSGRITATPDI